MPCCRYNRYYCNVCHLSIKSVLTIPTLEGFLLAKTRCKRGWEQRILSAHVDSAQFTAAPVNASAATSATATPACATECTAERTAENT